MLKLGTPLSLFCYAGANRARWWQLRHGLKFKNGLDVGPGWVGRRVMTYAVHELAQSSADQNDDNDDDYDADDG
ncbi:hypothetical protein M0802_012045 [Mischocyttarus mexicanus]|nr:hypothetical protein M0802_012045 [Mischocyttarus mexicanus]